MHYEAIKHTFTQNSNSCFSGTQVNKQLHAEYITVVAYGLEKLGVRNEGGKSNE